MKKKILVSGLLNVETTVAVKGFPISYYPIDYPFFGVNSNVAGVGCNIAKALTALGDKVSLMSFLGNDPEAERIINDLDKYGIKTKNISMTLKNTPTSVILFTPDGKRQIYCDLKDIQEQKISQELFSEKVKSSDLAVLCNINFNREIIKKAKDFSIPIATDVHVLSSIDDDYNRDFMENADILFLSDERLPCSPEEFIIQLHERYNNNIIVIGLGEKGALLFDENLDKLVLVPAYSTGNVVNTVGAGDSLFSAFVHYYAKGYTSHEALKRAVIFAGIKIGYNGASLGFSSEEDIEKLAAQ